MTSDTLLQKLKSGDEAAYRDIFIEYYPLLLSFAFKIIRNEDHAKDAVQNVFVKLFSSREHINVQEDLRAYLFTAVRNECLNLIKKETRMQQHHEEIQRGVNESFFVDAIEEAEHENRIFKAISELPTQCRKIFTMSRLEEKKNHEIAAELGISVRTVETQISNALKTLRKALLQLLFF